MTPQRETATLELPTHAEKGVRCAECAVRESAHRSSSSTASCGWSATRRGMMRVDYDASTILVVADLEAETRRFGAELEGVYRHAMWRIGGLDCPDCARTLARSVEMLPGVVSAELNFASAMLLVEHDTDADPSATGRADRRERRTQRRGGQRDRAGLRVRGGRAPAPAHPRRGPAGALAWARSHRSEVAVVGSGVFIAIGWVLGAVESQRRVGKCGGSRFVRLLPDGRRRSARACSGPVRWRRFRARSLDMNVLMTIAVVGATAIGQVEEAATVVFLFAFGGWLEARALARTRSSIRGLMELAPQVVRLKRQGGDVEVPPSEAHIGEIAIVRPGERIPLDGEVVTGVSAVDESAVTGEPLPAAKQPGDAVYAGSLNGNGLLEVRVTALAEDSTLARIVFLVEEAQASRAPIAAARGPLQPGLHAGGGGHRSPRRSRAAATGADARRRSAGHLR